LDSDDEDFKLNTQGFVSLGSGANRQYDDWNRAKKEFADLIGQLTGISAMLLGVGAPFRH